MNINFLDHNLLKELQSLSKKTDFEICGFINNNIFKHCKNLHPDPLNYFLISHKDYFENQNSILFHSHPFRDYDNGFSEWDLNNQKFHCLDMLLFSVKLNRFFFKKYDSD